MKRSILIALVVSLVAPIIAPPDAEAGLFRRGREELRDRGSTAGKVIAVTRRGDSLRADVLVYANLLEARVSCVTLSDLDRVDRKLALGTSLYVNTTGDMTDDGCSVARLWRPIGKSPKADAIVGIRHAIAVWLYGTRFPDAMKRFIGDGDRQLKMREIEKLAESTPDVIEAFRVWGIDLTDYGESGDRIDELERANRRLLDRIEELESGGASAASFAGTEPPSDCSRCFEAMRGIATHMDPLEAVVWHVAGAQGGVGHHPGLEHAVAAIETLVEPFVPSDGP